MVAVSPRVNSLDLVRVAQVLGQLAGEVEHGRGRAGLAEREVAHRRAVVLAHGRVGQLPAGRLGQQPHRRLVPGPQPCSRTTRAANEWYVATVGSPASWASCPSSRLARPR